MLLEAVESEDENLALEVISEMSPDEITSEENKEAILKSLELGFIQVAQIFLDSGGDFNSLCDEESVIIALLQNSNSKGYQLKIKSFKSVSFILENMSDVDLMLPKHKHILRFMMEENPGFEVINIKKLFERFIKNKFDFNLECNFNKRLSLKASPLILALRNRDDEIVQLLLDHMTADDLKLPIHQEALVVAIDKALSPGYY